MIFLFYKEYIVCTFIIHVGLLCMYFLVSYMSMCLFVTARVFISVVGEVLEERIITCTTRYASYIVPAPERNDIVSRALGICYGRCRQTLFSLSPYFSGAAPPLSRSSCRPATLLPCLFLTLLVSFPPHPSVSYFEIPPLALISLLLCLLLSIPPC